MSQEQKFAEGPQEGPYKVIASGVCSHGLGHATVEGQGGRFQVSFDGEGFMTLAEIQKGGKKTADDIFAQGYLAGQAAEREKWEKLRAILNDQENGGRACRSWVLGQMDSIERGEK